MANENIDHNEVFQVQELVDNHDLAKQQMSKKKQCLLFLIREYEQHMYENTDAENFEK